MLAVQGSIDDRAPAPPHPTRSVCSECGYGCHGCYLLAKRSEYYRDAFNNLAVEYLAFQKKAFTWKKQAAVTHTKPGDKDDELVLLRAQLKAREEECAVLRAKEAAATREVQEMRPQLAMFKAQLAASCKDREHLAQAYDHIREVNEQIRKVNDELRKELKRLEVQLMGTEWQHKVYNIGVKALKDELAIAKGNK